MSIASRVRTGSAWIAGTRILTNGLGLLSTLVTARLLTPDDFGVVAIGTTIQLIVASVTELSLAQAIIHCENPDDRHLDCAFTLNVLRGLILAVLLVAASPLIVSFYGDPRLLWVMSAIALSILISSVENPKLALMNRELVFWQDFVLQLTSKIAMIVVALAVALLTRSYLALIFATIASALARQITSYFFVPYRPGFRLKEYKDLLGFSGWVTLSQIVNTLSWRMDPLIVGKFLSPFAVGLFTVSSRLAQIPTQETTSPLTGTLFPAFRQIRNEPHRLRAAYMRAQMLVTAIALPCGVLMAILAKPLILLALGEKWLPAVPIIQVLSATMGLQTLASVAHPLAMATGNTRLLFSRSLQGISYRLPLMIAALWLYGLPGFLVMKVFMCLMAIALDMWIVKRVSEIGYFRQLSANLRTLAAALSMAIVAYFSWPPLDFGQSILQLLGTIVAVGGLSILTYAMVLFGLWYINGKPVGPEADMLHAIGRAIRQGRQIRSLIRS